MNIDKFFGAFFIVIIVGAIFVATHIITTGIKQERDDNNRCVELGYRKYSYNADDKGKLFNEKCYTLNADGTIKKEIPVKFE